MVEPAGAVLCGIARDEDRAVVDWIAHHLALGFARIHLYDNMSRVPVRDLLSDRALREHVTVVRWPSVEGGNAQLSAYDHFLQTHRGDSAWAAFLDLDEFLNLKTDETVDAFLARFPAAQAVAVNWRLFGSGGETDDRTRPLTERFRRASEIGFDPNRLVKTIHRLADVRAVHQHHGTYDGEPHVVRADGVRVLNGPHVIQAESSFAVAQVNHYFVKSPAEWADKNRRGYTDGTLRPPEMFAQYDRNETGDETILRFAARTRAFRAIVRRPDPAPSWLAWLRT